MLARSRHTSRKLCDCVEQLRVFVERASFAIGSLNAMQKNTLEHLLGTPSLTFSGGSGLSMDVPVMVRGAGEWCVRQGAAGGAAACGDRHGLRPGRSPPSLRARLGSGRRVGMLYGWICVDYWKASRVGPGGGGACQCSTCGAPVGCNYSGECATSAEPARCQRSASAAPRQCTVAPA